MAILVGIDEAGYGPILGPLVVSASVFELPDALLGKSLWQVLPRSVCKNRQGAGGRLVINDSKKLYLARGRYHLLQRGVLAALIAAGNDPPGVLGDLLCCLEATCREHFSQYPWYGPDAEVYPLNYNSGDISTAANALVTELKEHHIRLHTIWSRPILTGSFNQMIQTVNNKATVLFTVASELIYQAYQKFNRDNLQILIDKHGGRSHYRAQLQRLFPDLNMKIIKEEDCLSSYHLTGSGSSMKIHFIARGDDRHLPVALASMTSKYVRELFMELLNRYFQRHCPTITPTAGYYQDGRRFLNDLKSHNLDPQLAPHHLLVRQR